MPYQYLWKDSANNVFSIDSFVNGLPSAGYQLTIIDSKGCQTLALQDIQLSTSPRIQTIVTTNVSCYGDSTGAAILESFMYAYPFAPCTIEWSNGDTGLVAKRLSAGTYNITLRDINGCVDNEPFRIEEPAIYKVEIINAILPSCYSYNDGGLSVESQGGNGDDQFYWSTGDSSMYIENIIAGIYNVVGMDRLGCTDTATITLTQPDSLEITLVRMIQPTHNLTNGLLEINVAGGTKPYSYSWSNGDSTLIAEYLDYGDYSITVRDNNGCTLMRTFALTYAVALVSIDTAVDNNLIVYPNPTDGKVYIRNIIDNEDVFVYNMKSLLLFRTQGSVVDFSTYPIGIYLLRVGNKSIKVIKK
jgi:hypothetical protein